MGAYINPPNETKEDWVERNCHIAFGRDVPNWKEAYSQGCLPVCIVQNVAFSAAAIAYSEDELKVFSDPRDNRPKRYYTVPISKLLEVSDLSDYLRDPLEE